MFRLIFLYFIHRFFIFTARIIERNIVSIGGTKKIRKYHFSYEPRKFFLKLFPFFRTEIIAERRHAENWGFFSMFTHFGVYKMVNNGI